ncbi:MAG: glycoside hydrolase family 55 protein [Saprospiraceae bacterium]|nr:glycoside hydrolase family 55 protein [Saprospiraceae bacterium]
MASRPEKLGAVLFLVVLCLSCNTVPQPTGDTLNVKDFGAKGNGIQDDTEAIQHAIDLALGNGAQEVFFPRGTYLVSSLDVNGGLRLFSHGNATLLKMPNSGKYSRIINTYNYTKSYGVRPDPLIIENFLFDGNRMNQGAYRKYELEQQALIFLSGNRNDSTQLHVSIKDCSFREGVGDAIGIYYNVNVEIDRCVAENVFRGGITATGGNTTITARDFKAFGDVHKTGIDIEIDAGGYKNSKFVDVTLHNVWLAGDFDIGLKGDEARVEVDSLHCDGPPYNIYAPGASVLIQNSTFLTDRLSQCKITYPEDVTFEKCKFISRGLDSSEARGCARVSWSTGYSVRHDQQLNFRHCAFISENDTPGTSYGIFVNPCDISRANVLSVEQCTFSNGFDDAIHLKQGGTIEVTGMQSEAKRDLVLRSVMGKHKYRFSAALRNMHSNKDEGLRVYYANDNENILQVDQQTMLGLIANKKSRSHPLQVELLQ